MKKIITLAALAFTFAVSPVQAITIDGNLSDWGVTPFTDWTPSSASAGYSVQDNTTSAPVTIPLTEDWDVEALYFDNDATHLYYAIVTSRDQTWGEGDLAIDLDGDKDWDYGVDLTSFGASNNVVNRGVYRVTDWETKHGIEYGIPMMIEHGTQLGTAPVVQKFAGAIEPGKTGIFANTYIIEGEIDISMLGLTSLCNLPIELVFAKVSCLRDYIRLDGVCTGNCGGPTPVPEPSTMLLLGSALLGVSRFRTRRSA